MKVLYVTNMYPLDDNSYYGIHVKEQIESLKIIYNFQSNVYFINGRMSNWNYFKSIIDVKNQIKNNQYDLIHIHYGISGLFLLFYKPKLPIIITLHSGELFGKKNLINRFLQRRITLKIINKVNKIIVLNDETILFLKKYSSKIFKLPCGTDINFFKENNAQKNVDKLIIGFPGSKARKEKNFELFKKIIKKLETFNKVEIVEFRNMSRKVVVENLNKLDLLLMTSIVEGSPQIIKEAMACNTPIVSTVVGDVEDLLEGVSNSYIVNSFDPNSFIGPIKSIIQLPQEKRKSNGREKLIRMGLDSGNVVKRLYKLYKETI